LFTFKFPLKQNRLQLVCYPAVFCCGSHGYYWKEARRDALKCSILSSFIGLAADDVPSGPVVQASSTSVRRQGISVRRKAAVPLWSCRVCCHGPTTSERKNKRSSADAERYTLETPSSSRPS